MPSRNKIDTAALLKLESVYGTDSVPAPATDAMLLKNFECKTIVKMVPRELLRPWFGKDPELPAYSMIQGKFTVELGGSGAAGTATQWGKLLRGAGRAETVTAVTRCDYTLLSAAYESLSGYFYDSGRLKKGLGMRLAISGMRLLHSQRPEMDFDFLALDGGDTAVVTPATTLTAWKAPTPITTANSGLVTLGCTYATGALSGGTTYTGSGLELTGEGQNLEFQELLGAEAIEASGRDIKGRSTFDLTAAQEVSFLSTYKAGTTQSLGFLHGSAPGYKLLNYFPSAQIDGIDMAEGKAGKRLVTLDFSFTPSAGNDDWRCVTL